MAEEQDIKPWSAETICGICDGWIINTHNWDDDEKCDCIKLSARQVARGW
jgi:hypothetical protein